MSKSVGLVWIRRDFREQDHWALHHALENHDQVLLVYVHAPHEEHPWEPGAASRWWQHHSMLSLMQSLNSHKNTLHIAQGDSATELAKIAKEVKAEAIYAHHLYEPALQQQQQTVSDHLMQQGVACHFYNRALLCDPAIVSPNTKNGYTVFTPYWKYIQTLMHMGQVLGAPGSWSEPKPTSKSLTVDDLNLVTGHAWEQKLAKHWTPGEAQAQEDLDLFCEAILEYYETDRDIPSRSGTSQLSAALHFGELTPHQVWQAVSSMHKNPPSHMKKVTEKPIFAFLRQLGWREFAHHVLHHNPKTPTEPLNKSYKSFPWDKTQSPSYLAWRDGTTGWPMVDASMNQLWETGWMHNRMRMLSSGVLTKQLGVSWELGARWFWDTLVDANLANNTLGWQWSAGCGADAAPYFRILSPARQHERFDPKDLYINKWLPNPVAKVTPEQDKALREQAMQRYKKKRR